MCYKLLVFTYFSFTLETNVVPVMQSYSSSKLYQHSPKQELLKLRLDHVKKSKSTGNYLEESFKVGLLYLNKNKCYHKPDTFLKIPAPLNNKHTLT